MTALYGLPPAEPPTARPVAVHEGGREVRRGATPRIERPLTRVHMRVEHANVDLGEVRGSSAYIDARNVLQF
jgi:hypothetical protein